VDPATLIQTHGYWALALGCLLEGETLLVLAGFAAHLGYLQLPWVVAVAAVAGFAGDQFFFWLGRRHSAALLRRFPSLQRQAARAHRLIEAHPSAFVIGMRFAYGMRIAAPLIAGNSPLPAARFAALNAVGALLWASIVGGLGWVFGRTAEAVLGDLRHVEGWLALALVAALLLVAVWRRWR
jgi:membrane protein DedA with SNARE-associated domain